MEYNIAHQKKTNKRPIRGLLECLLGQYKSLNEEYADKNTKVFLKKYWKNILLKTI